MSQSVKTRRRFHLHKFRDHAWAIVSLGVASQIADSTELAALVGPTPAWQTTNRGDPISRHNRRPVEWSSVLYRGYARADRGTAEEQLAALAPVLTAIAEIPEDRRPSDLVVGVTVHLSVLTNAARISPDLLRLLADAGAEVDFWTDQEGRDRRPKRSAIY